MEGEPKGIPLDQLPPQALMNLKKQFEDVYIPFISDILNICQEMVVLAQSLEQFKTAYSKFEDSRNIIKGFGDPANKSQKNPVTNFC